MPLDEFSSTTTKKCVPGPGAYDLPSDFDTAARGNSARAATMKFREVFASTILHTGTNEKVGPSSYQHPPKFGVNAPAFSIPQSGLHTSPTHGPRSQSPNKSDAHSNDNNSNNFDNYPQQFSMATHPGSPAYTIGIRLPPPAQQGCGASPGPQMYNTVDYGDEWNEQIKVRLAKISGDQAAAHQQHHPSPPRAKRRGAPMAFRSKAHQSRVPMDGHDNPGPAEYDVPRFPEHNLRRHLSPIAEQQAHGPTRKHTFGASVPVVPSEGPGPGQYDIKGVFDKQRSLPAPPVVPGAVTSAAEASAAAGAGSGDVDAPRTRTTFGGRGGVQRRVVSNGPGPAAYTLPSGLQPVRNGVSISGRYHEYHDMDDVYPTPGPGQYNVNNTARASTIRSTTIPPPPPAKPARQIDPPKVSEDNTFEQGVYHPERADGYFQRLGPRGRIAWTEAGQPTVGEAHKKMVEANKAERSGEEDIPFRRSGKDNRTHKCPFGQLESEQQEISYKLSQRNAPAFSLSSRTTITGFLGPSDPSLPGAGAYFDAEKDALRKKGRAVVFSSGAFGGSYAPRIMSVEEKKEVLRRAKQGGGGGGGGGGGSARRGGGGGGGGSPSKNRPGSSRDTSTSGSTVPKHLTICSLGQSSRTPGATVDSPASGIDFYLNKLGGLASVTQAHATPGPNKYNDSEAWAKLHSPRSVKLSPRVPHSELPSRVKATREAMMMSRS